MPRVCQQCAWYRVFRLQPLPPPLRTPDLLRLTTARVPRHHCTPKARAANALCERMYVYIICINLEVGLRPGNERRRRLTR